MSTASLINIVLVTVPDERSASHIAKVLVERKLAACVNILPQIHSVFRWQGKVDEADELLLIIKAKASRFMELAEAIRALHPYDVPEIIALNLADGLEKYCSWVLAETD